MIKINVFLLVAVMNIGAMEYGMNTSVQLPSEEILKIYLDEHCGYLSGIKLHEKFGGKVASPHDVENYLLDIEPKIREETGVESPDFFDALVGKSIEKILKLTFKDYPQVLEELTKAGRIS